jgi:hypothetical protein
MRNPRKAYIHTIDWEKDIIYYVDHFSEAGFTDLLSNNDTGIQIEDEENDSLAFLFTAYIDDPLKNVNFAIFSEVLTDIMYKRSKTSIGVFRGDIVYLNFIANLQDAFLFWDGYHLIRGDLNKNNKYKIPSQFRIFEEFPPSYWDKFPYDKFHEEPVVITQNLLKSGSMRVYLTNYVVFFVYFQSHKYIVVMSKPFAEKVLDSVESKEFICSAEEIPNEVMDYLRSQGMDSSTIYDRTIKVQDFDEDELLEMMEELNF